MNDRFKFRCFSRKTKKMYEVDSLHLDSENEWVWVHYYNPIYDKELKIQIEHPKAIVMQSTGLKDKNGKLIYEGDVVEFYSQSLLDAMSRKGLKRRVGQVVWNDEFLKFDVIVGNNAVPHLCKETDDNNFEVIGNIYENKDLLNENS